MVLLAHQGGWDEALFAVGPLLFIVGLLRFAKGRADRARVQPVVPQLDPGNDPLL